MPVTVTVNRVCTTSAISSSYSASDRFCPSSRLPGSLVARASVAVLPRAVAPLRGNIWKFYSKRPRNLIMAVGLPTSGPGVHYFCISRTKIPAHLSNRDWSEASFFSLYHSARASRCPSRHFQFFLPIFKFSCHWQVFCRVSACPSTRIP